jgi:hypothetical protein
MRRQLAELWNEPRRTTKSGTSALLQSFYYYYPSFTARLVPELIYRENQFVLLFLLLMLFDWEFGSPHEVVSRVTATAADALAGWLASDEVKRRVETEARAKPLTSLASYRDIPSSIPSCHVEFLKDKVALWFSSEHFRFPNQFSPY